MLYDLLHLWRYLTDSRYRRWYKASGILLHAKHHIWNKRDPIAMEAVEVLTTLYFEVEDEYNFSST